jgi:undecaprenyl-diphosphatase
MPLYQALILAVVQGLTEFLPISSTAHLALVPQLLRWPELEGVSDLTFDVALHAGTLVAVLLYFWKMWLDMLRAAAGLAPARCEPHPARAVAQASGGRQAWRAGPAIGGG